MEKKIHPDEDLASAVCANDADLVSQALERHPELTARINEPMVDGAFGSTPLLAAVGLRNKAMIDALLRAGADINARSHWWAGSWGVLDCDHGLDSFLLDRGAAVDAHAAARMGMLERLSALVTAQPELVRARGGDGQTPLHFAASVAIARFLLDRGADVNALDIDHESTPAQHMVKDRQDVARYLITRGAKTDVLMAAALGDIALVKKHLDLDPASIRTSVCERYFPKKDPRSGGTIYIWTLGAHKTAHPIARSFGHEEVLRLLRERSPPELKLALACEEGDETALQSLLESHPDLAGALLEEDKKRLAHAAQDNDTRAVRLLLKAGWPLDVRGQHRGTPLHWAAWHGNAEMVKEILRRKPDLELAGDEFNMPALGWALHGSIHGWHRQTGDYAGAVEALLDAGARAPKLTDKLQASEPVLAVLRRR